MFKLKLPAGEIFTLKGTEICTLSNGARAATLRAEAASLKLVNTISSKKTSDNDLCRGAGRPFERLYEYAMISRRNVCETAQVRHDSG